MCHQHSRPTSRLSLPRKAGVAGAQPMRGGPGRTPPRNPFLERRSRQRRQPAGCAAFYAPAPAQTLRRLQPLSVSPRGARGSAGEASGEAPVKRRDAALAPSATPPRSHPMSRRPQPLSSQGEGHAAVEDSPPRAGVRPYAPPIGDVAEAFQPRRHPRVVASSSSAPRSGARPCALATR